MKMKPVFFISQGAISMSGRIWCFWIDLYSIPGPIDVALLPYILISHSAEA